MTERVAGTLALLRHHRIAVALRAAALGNEPHFVGGVLRDRLLGLPAYDYDAVVAADGRGVGERLASALNARLIALGGERFAAYRLVGRDFTLDLWDRAGATVAADLERRDLTVNALALDLESGACLDPHGGLQDLRVRVLRAVGSGAFRADPLRSLRLPRLIVQLPGFAADPATIGLARAEVPRLGEVAAERVRDELRRLFEGAEAHRGLLLLQALEIYPGLWLGRSGDPRPAEQAIDELERLADAALVLRRTALGWADELDLPTARWASTFAALAAVVDPRDALRRFAAAGYLARRDAERVAALLLVPELPRTPLAMRHFLHDSAELWPTAAVWLGSRAARQGKRAAWQAWLASLVELLDTEGKDLLDPPVLVRGEEVKSLLGLSSGPEIGQALARIRAAQIEGRVRSREDALALLRRPP